MITTSIPRDEGREPLVRECVPLWHIPGTERVLVRLDDGSRAAMLPSEMTGDVEAALVEEKARRTLLAQDLHEALPILVARLRGCGLDWLVDRVETANRVCQGAAKEVAER